MRKIGSLFLLILVGAIVISSFADAATPTFYTDRTTFEAALNTIITDDYSPALGYPAGFGIYDNSTMSGFFNQTNYEPTGWSNQNIIQTDISGVNNIYCAGCNGSFRLSFASTSVTESGIGVVGVGLNIIENLSSLPYYAYIVYGDGTSQSVALPVVVWGGATSFFGVTAPELIQSIHFGLSGGASTIGGSFSIDNLTIGNQQQTQAIPTMSEWGMIIFMVLAGLGSVYYLRRQRRG